MPVVNAPLLTIDMVTLEALAVLENELTFTKQIRRKYDSYFAIAGAKIGDTLRVRKPIRNTVRTGQGWSPQGVGESYVNVTLDTQMGVDTEFSTADLTLKIDEFSDRILKPQIAQLANQVDDAGLQLAIQANMAIGTPGTAITAPLGYLTAGAKMKEAAAPMGNWSIVINPAQEVQIVNGLVTYFNPSAEISRQYKKGLMGTAFGFDWYMDQNVYTHTTGNFGASTPLMNGATLDGALSLVTNGWVGATNTVKQGDVLQVAAVNAANPQNYRSTGRLQDFLVTADATSDGAGNMTIPVTVWGMPLMSTGVDKNIDALPLTGAAITMYGAGAGALAAISSIDTPQGLAFHPDFATLVSADLYMPKGTDMASRKSDGQLGFSMRYIRDYDPVTDQLVSRFDILFGWALLRSELVVRIAT
jgi:hypothetical protein